MPQLIGPFNHTNYDFITKKSEQIPDQYIQAGETLINRFKTQSIINDLLNDFEKALTIELSIFEFALIYCYTRNYDYEYIKAIYNDKLYGLVQNITDKKIIKNLAFIKKLKNDSLNLKQVAFLNPSEIHPESWEHFIIKKKCIENREKNIKYSDNHKCYNCGESKCIISLFQTRSADEPMTTFITCVVCHKVYKC